MLDIALGIAHPVYQRLSRRVNECEVRDERASQCLRGDGAA